MVHATLWFAWTSKVGPDFQDRLMRGDVRVW